MANDDLLWPPFSGPDDLAEVERVPLSDRGLPASTKPAAAPGIQRITLDLLDGGNALPDLLAIPLHGADGAVQLLRAGDLFQELAERFGRDRLVADERELVLDQRMIDDGDAFHGMRLLIG